MSSDLYCTANQSFTPLEIKRVLQTLSMLCQKQNSNQKYYPLNSVITWIALRKFVKAQMLSHW